jgi:hypothetical protein
MSQAGGDHTERRSEDKRELCHEAQGSLMIAFDRAPPSGFCRFSCSTPNRDEFLCILNVVLLDDSGPRAPLLFSIRY